MDMATHPKAGHVLIVDDDPGVLISARLALAPHFASVESITSPDGLDEIISSLQVDAVLLDMNFSPGQHSGKDGLDWLGRLLRMDPTLSVVMMTAFGGLTLAVEALKRGAADFILKPWQNEKLVATLLAATSLSLAKRETLQAQLRSAETSSAANGRMIGTSPSLQRLYRTIQKSAPTDANIFITGESGTGKELAAREIHRLSRRRSGPFVTIDFAGIAESEFEAELFGQKRGTTPFADTDRSGKLQAADKGTVYFDEIGKLPTHLQRKLLAAIEQQEVTPIGGSKPVGIDIRAITSSTLSPVDLCDGGHINRDLALSLQAVEIVIPPLRERGEDIGPLLDHFLGFYARKYNVLRRRLQQDVLRRLETYEWPSNVRELRHSAERATLLSGSERLGIEDFPFLLVRVEPSESDFDLDRLEKKTIGRAIVHFNGNISLAARALGLTRPALYRRLEKHGL